jgi:hypothetical protein
MMIPWVLLLARLLLFMVLLVSVPTPIISQLLRWNFSIAIHYFLFSFIYHWYLSHVVNPYLTMQTISKISSYTSQSFTWCLNAREFNGWLSDYNIFLIISKFWNWISNFDILDIWILDWIMGMILVSGEWMGF